MAYDGLSERTQRSDHWPETGGDKATDQSRDRLAVHGVWESLLAVVVVMGSAVIYQIRPDALAGTGLQSFLLFAASLGLIAVSAAWSLRAAVPNLAVGSIAVGAAVFFGQQSQGGFWFGLFVTLGAAVALGVLLGLLVVGPGVPAWAGSLVVMLLLGGWLSLARWVDPPNVVRYDPADHALYWFFGFVGASLLGGALGAIGSTRRTVGGYRPSGDPAERAGFAPRMAGFGGLVGSSALAALGGVLLALVGRGSTADLGIGWTGLAFGAVLLGGTSAYGRRGGVAGTVLGVLLLGLGVRFAADMAWEVPVVAVAGVAVLIGLLVTRMVETFGRSRRSVEGDAPEWTADAARWAPPPDNTAHWTAAPPYRGGSQLMALPAGRSADAAPPVRSGGTTGPAGVVAPGSHRGAGSHGGIGDRAARLPLAPTSTTPTGVISGDIVPDGQAAIRHQHGAFDDQAPPRNRIWDV